MSLRHYTNKLPTSASAQTPLSACMFNLAYDNTPALSTSLRGGRHGSAHASAAAAPSADREIIIYVETAGKKQAMPIKGRGAKAKGDTYERDLAAFFTEVCGIPCHRTPLSGGGRGEALPDITGTHGLAIEAKRHERMSVDEWMRQARKNCGLDRPVVINRKSRQPLHDSYVILHLQDFADLYRAWLTQQGYVKESANDRDSNKTDA